MHPGGDHISLESGLEICFTGSATDASGAEIDREALEALAERHGLVPKRSVTAKACGLLVVADVATRSGKGDAARKFGGPVAAVEDFLTAVETGRPLKVTRFEKAGVALVCVQCGHSWIAARRSSQPLCSDCK